MSKSHYPIVNLANARPARNLQHADRFEATVAPLSPQLGAKKLAYNVTVVAPGKRAFPFHNHHENEELFLILEGTGTLRYGDREYPVGVGDLIGCPPGGTETAHQLVNSGSVPLRYLAISTTLPTDVFQYPDSGKFGVVARRLPGTPPADAPFAGFYEEAARKEYFEGE